MKSGRRKVFAVLIILLLIASWTVSFTGIGDKFDNLGKQLKYGLDINGGVYVLLEADSKETGTELTAIMNQTKSVLRRSSAYDDRRGRQSRTEHCHCYRTGR